MNMNKNMALALVLLCLTSLGALQCVKSQSTSNVFINPDGSVSGTSDIQHSGNLYTLAGNIYDQILVIESNNIVVDGGGFTLQGAGGWGAAGVAGKESSAAINLTCSNVTIQNFKITGWEVGIYCPYNNNTITSNFISETRSCIAIYADNYNVVGNYLANSIDGVLDKGNNDIFSKNWILNDWQAFLIYYQSSGHIITGNRIENNTEAINTYNGQGLEIYHNNFINNQKNVATISDAFSAPLGGSGGTLPPWDNGKEGNYWSNYTGVDANHDGIGDTPYVVRSDIYTVDRYPLIPPLDIPEPSVTPTFASALPSPDTSSTPPLNGDTNLSNSTATTQPSGSSSTGEKNTQLQVTLAIIAAALAVYLIVLIAIGTFRSKKSNKCKLENQEQNSQKQ
jgi:hypothetical protein